ncbi:MAG: precorrin-2 dehydrogenase/sirohydrochlorin ferrochelatase family protein [Longimicrobiaceae bacterium]
MKPLYACLLDLSSVRVLVVGGGRVARRKALGVIEAGGSPVVVAPAACPDLERLANQRRLTLERRRYRSPEADGYGVVFAATSDPAVNRQVAGDAGGWVNVADHPGVSTLHTPAVVRRGGVVATVSTGGAAPLLAGRLRDRVAAAIPPGAGKAARRLSGVRKLIHGRWPDDPERRHRCWQELVSEEFVDAALRGDDQDVKERIERCLLQS